MDAQLLRGEPTPSHGKRLPRWAVAALSCVATIAAYQAFASPQTPQIDQLFSLDNPDWTLPNGENSLREALTNLENQVNTQSAAIESLQGGTTPSPQEAEWAREDAERDANDAARYRCHPMDGLRWRINVEGWDDGQAYEDLPWPSYLSSSHEGRWIIARGNSHNASEFFFQALDEECDTYYLVEGGSRMNQDENNVGFANCGKWLRSTYSRASAMPIKFLSRDHQGWEPPSFNYYSERGSGEWKMKSAYAGEETFLGYATHDDHQCESVHHARSIHLGYADQQAASVRLEHVGGKGKGHGKGKGKGKGKGMGKWR